MRTEFWWGNLLQDRERDWKIIFRVSEVDGTGSGLCPAAGFGISGSVSTTTQVVFLMMEAARTSETSVNFYQNTRRYNPEEAIFVLTAVRTSNPIP
jgi:hypothetical protein